MESIFVSCSSTNYRDKLGYVPQKGVLFSGNIASNIMFGNVEGSETEMKEAAEIAQATEFIEAKHKKYESSISQEKQIYRADRSSVFLLLGQLQSTRIFLFLMIAFLHWITRRMWRLEVRLRNGLRTVPC